jgi:hypothetical protein
VTDFEALVSRSEPYFYYSATLRIFGAIEDPDIISSCLGLEPTHVHRKGDRRGPRSPAYKHDAWHYTAPVPEERPLDVHIQTLWAHLKPHKDYLLRLKERHTVDVFCGYRSSSGTAGFEVAPESLEMFLALRIPFGVSVIVA